MTHSLCDNYITHVALPRYRISYVTCHERSCHNILHIMIIEYIHNQNTINNNYYDYDK